MEFRHLEVFMAVWQSGSITQAAKTLNLTQPTVSSHLKGLEEEVGVKLFDRIGKAITPTSGGRRFYGYCKQILRLRDELKMEITQLLDEASGTIEIGGSNIPGQYILPRIIGSFKELYPDIQVVLKIGDTANIVSLVQTGAVELGVVGALMEKRGLVFESCFKDKLVFAFPPSFKHLLKKDAVEAKDISRERFILREHGSGTRLATEIALQNEGIDIRKLNVVAEMGSTEAIKQAVKAGVGCAIISERAVREDIDSGAIKFIPFKGQSMNRLFYLVWHKKRTLSPPALLFKNYLLKKKDL